MSARERLLQTLNTHPTGWDLAILNVEVAQLSRLERGRLMARMMQGDPVKRTHPEVALAGMLEHGTSATGLTPPLFDGETAGSVLAALAAWRHLPPPKSPGPLPTGWDEQIAWHRRIAHLCSMVCRHLVELPDPAGRAALHDLLHAGLLTDRFDALLARRISGETSGMDALEAAIVADADGPLAQVERRAVLTIPVPALARAGSFLARHDSAEAAAEGSAIRADAPAYRACAQAIIEEATTRAAEVASGDRPYASDGLMTVDEAQAVGRAMALALSEDMPWGIDALETLWRGAALAPDPKVKSMPSQSLTIRLAHETVTVPHPVAVNLLAALSKEVRHAGVKKKLERLAKSAMTALKEQPERLLDMAPDAFTPALAKLLPGALEGLLLRERTVTVGAWSAQFTTAAVWPAVGALIWQVDGRALRPRKAGRTMVWQTASGHDADVDGAMGIRLWHPADGTDAQDWRDTYAAAPWPQPFAQIEREVLRVTPAEATGKDSHIFADHSIDEIAAFGIARRTGFHPLGQTTLVLVLAGQRFAVDLGVAVYPGAGGRGKAGAVSLLGPAGCFADVAPRVLAEALRRIALVVHVGARAAA